MDGCLIVFFIMYFSFISSFPANICFYPTEFRAGKAPILIATDVASRGLGMSNQLPHLIFSHRCYIYL